MTVSRMIARPMLATMFVVGGVDSLRNATAKAPVAAAVTEKVAAKVKPAAERISPSLPVPTDPVTYVRLNAAAQVVAGLSLATGRAPRLSAAVLAASLVPTTIAGHRFWEKPDEQSRKADRIHFLKNVSMFGGLLIAAGDTEGRPGVAWRARRAARDARREARHLAATARREAALAKAKVS